MLRIKKFSGLKYSVIKVLVLYYALMIVNFFATPNPYSAMNSGRAGYLAAVYSTEMRVSQLTILLIVLMITVVSLAKISISINYLCLITLSLLSGILNGIIFQEYRTYIFNILTWILLFTVTYCTCQEENVEDVRIAPYIKPVVCLAILGIILAIIRPNIYGIFNFSFNRTTRSSITFWGILGLDKILVPLFLTLYEKKKIKKYLIFAIFTAVVLVSTAVRSSIIYVTIVIAIYFIFRIKRNTIAFILAFLPLTILFYFDSLVSLLMESIGLGVESLTIETIVTVLNGRFELWLYYLNAFCKQPLIGYGYGASILGIDYTGIATSEIGILKCFTECGIIYGSLICYVILKAILSAITILKKRNCTEIELFLSYVILANIVNLSQAYSRIDSISSVLFWFAVMYINLKYTNEKYWVMNWKKHRVKQVEKGI